MEFDVTVDRDKYIGGSDIPIIMGISPFKTRYQLLLEKAGIEVSTFTGNRYTEYGDIMEPKIRDYINELYFTNFEPGRVIDEDTRYHSDGFNGVCVLEVKTTSQTHEKVEEYKVYLVQLLFGMQKNKVANGLLAVYERPEDFNEEFDPERLTAYPIKAEDYIALTAEINAEVDRFRGDLKRLRENPLLCEEDFQPNELITLSNKLLAFERQLAAYKALEKQYEDMKQQLFEAMQKHDVTSWETANGVKITRVDGVEATTEIVTNFDEAMFATDYPDLYGEYLKETVKKKNGRKGYVRISVPKVV